jgi:hypothetical protein
MAHHDEAVATDRLRRALLAFQTARNLHLNAHRRLMALLQAEVEAFWDGPGRRVGEILHAPRWTWTRPLRRALELGW